VARARYWLELHGEKLGNDNTVPPQLAALVFETQEKLDELRAATGEQRRRLAAAVGEELERLRREDSALGARMLENFAAWDDPANDHETLLRELKQILSKRAYLATLIRDVDETLGAAATVEAEG
jgi:hypothetical protein